MVLQASDGEERGPVGGEDKTESPGLGPRSPQTLSSSKYCSPLHQLPFIKLPLGQTLGSAEGAVGKEKVPAPKELKVKE